MTDPNSPNPSTSSSHTGSMREEVGEDFSRLKHAAELRADQEMEEGKHKAASAASSAASAIKEAAGTLREDQDAPDWLATALESTARKINHFAGAIEGRSMSDMRDDLNDFARENPGAFLAASAAAGFAAARFLRAGGEYKAHHKTEETRQSFQDRAPATDRSGAGAGGSYHSGGIDPSGQRTAASPPSTVRGVS